ncbi:hypothetical protein CASFOL_033491 [Castilleja foliolosa]|uniref:DUF676 domain-containing protein n=1 Tax=Castilleja foliolosa TaxID=1961234 RepID=A0ABD3C037_9LAMI
MKLKECADVGKKDFLTTPAVTSRRKKAEESIGLESVSRIVFQGERCVFVLVIRVYQRLICGTGSIVRPILLREYLSDFDLTGELPDYSSMDALVTIDFHNNMAINFITLATPHLGLRGNKQPVLSETPDFPPGQLKQRRRLKTSPTLRILEYHEIMEAVKNEWFNNAGAGWVASSRSHSVSLDDVRVNLEVLKHCATVLLLESILPPSVLNGQCHHNSSITTRSRSLLLQANNPENKPSRSDLKHKFILLLQWYSQGVTHHQFTRLQLVDLAGSERQKNGYVWAVILVYMALVEVPWIPYLSESRSERWSYIEEEVTNEATEEFFGMMQLLDESDDEFVYDDEGMADLYEIGMMSEDYELEIPPDLEPYEEPGTTYDGTKKEEDEEPFEALKEPDVENKRTPHEHVP